MNTSGYLFTFASVATGFGLLATTLFGDTVESKFSNAQTAVSSEVTFGGPPTRPAARVERPAQKRRHRPAVEPPPSRQEAAPSTEVNGVEDALRDRFSTFAVDVDTGSYTRTRRYLRADALPEGSDVRTEEFVNYFDYDYPEPDGPLGVHFEAGPAPFLGSARTYLLSVGLSAHTTPKTERKPVHLTFLVDVSGSMAAEDRLPLARESMKTLLRTLRPDDTVAIATYAAGSRVVLEPTPVEDARRIRAAIDSLDAAGATAMSAGMKLAYRLASTSAKTGEESRVIVLSDGDPNIGARSHEAILRRVEDYVAQGVTMSTVGFGMGNYRDDMMERLANAGDGNYSYVDSRAEALRVFGTEADGTLRLAARDVKVQVEFNPETVQQYRLLGYENRAVADEDFRNDQRDAGEVGEGHQVTALYEVTIRPNATGLLGTTRVRYADPQTQEFSEFDAPLTTDRLRTSLAQTSDDFRFATAVAAFSEKLRQTPRADLVSWNAITRLARSSADSRPERLEFLELVERARELKEPTRHDFRRTN